MIVPSEFVFLHYGTEILILADCNLLISKMVFVNNVQKLPITSKVPGSAFTCMQEER